MANQKVYEGEARLNIQPFLDALKKMETEAGSTGVNIAAVFKNLEQSLGGSIASLKGHLASVATEVSAIKSAVTQANTALKAGSQTQQQAAAQAKTAAQQASQASAQQVAAQKAAAIQQKLTAESASEIAHEAQMLGVAIHTQKMNQLNRMTAAEVLEYKHQGERVAAQLQANLTRQQAIQRQALLIAQRQQQNIATGVSAPGGAAEDIYRKAVLKADEAYRQISAIQKAQTAMERQQVGLRVNMTSRGIEDTVKATGGSIARLKSISTNFANEVGNAFTTAREKLKRYEDGINSVYRAGAQLTQLGSQLSMFAAGLAMLGKNLTNNAGEFDFWARRAAAAAKAAQDATGETLTGAERAIVSTEQFRERALQIGREVGVAAPEEIAKSWYIYQSAVGDVIRSTEDLAQHQHNLGSLMRAGIATGTDFAAVVRGTTAAMAEFGLGSTQLDYALSVMINTTQVTQAEFSDMLQAFKMAGPQANRLGMTIGDTAAAFAMLADQNIRGSQAGRLFQSGLTNLIRPTNQMKDALQDLMVTNRGLTGSWEQFFYKNGEFVGLFDQLNQKGETLNKGALHQFHEATKGMTAAQREFYLATIFGKDAGKAWSTMVAEYSAAQKVAEQAGDGAANKFEKMAHSMNDVTVQTEAFKSQWKEVADGIKVRMGIVMFSFEELKQRLGLILAEQLIPMLEKFKQLADGLMAWAEANPEAAASIVSLGIKIAAFTAVVGPLLIALGLIIQGIAGIGLVINTLSSFGGMIVTIAKGVPALIGLAGGFSALLGPIALVAAAIGLLYVAWKYNIGGMREILSGVVGLLGSEFKALASVFLSLGKILLGVFIGNSKMVEEGAKSLAVHLLEVFIVLPGKIGQSLMSLVNVLGQTFVGLSARALVWGRNLAVSLANGFIDGGRYLIQAAWSLAESVAKLFRSHSPPQYGPLRGIQQWGTNLVNTLIEGMSAADFSAIEEVAGRVGEAIKRNIEDGLAVPSTYAATMGSANNLVDDMLATVREGGRVNGDFFSTLRSGLGEWYEYITDIALAYQEVYANERALVVEKEKLAAIKGQREELEKANRARQDALDLAVGATDGFGLQQNQGAMVDPLTAEGKAKIAEMRQNLSREDFQNWIAFQKRLWEAQTAGQDKVLAAEEEAVQTQVDSSQVQLDAAQKQYDLYVKMYEYAVRMYNLAEEQKALEDAALEKDKAPLTLGTPEDLTAQLAEIARVIGKDQPVQDEGTVRARSQDDIDAIGNASEQREREEKRLSDLEKMNRRKRAEFEVQLINATSDEERTRIKQMKDAWDAAYQQEHSRLQERVTLAKEVQDATEALADATMAGRIDPQQAEFQRQITAMMGDQTKAIQDANALKALGGDLDDAKLRATGQLRDEERKLSDLQAVGDQKRLDFEQRIREAAGDPEKLRRIKEEQDAWDSAYKKAYEAQQLRVELSRRAQQDIGDAAAALSAASPAAGGFESPDFGDPAGAPEGGIPALKPPWLTDDGQINWDFLGLGENGKPRTSELQAITMFDDLGKAIKFLGDETVPTKDKLYLLGEAVKQALGWKTWWDALAPEETRENIKSYFAGIAKEIGIFFDESDENGGTARFKRGLAIMGGYFAETFGTDNENSITNMAGRGLAKVVALFGTSMGTDDPNSIVNMAGRGLTKLGEWAAWAFELDQPNSIANRARRGLEKVGEYFAQTMDEEANDPNSITNMSKRGLARISAYMTETFSPDSEKGIPQAAKRGLDKVVAWADETFNPDSPKGMPQAFQRGVKKVSDWMTEYFGLENVNSIPNQANRGLDKIKAFFNDILWGESPDSVSNLTKTGLYNLGLVFKDMFGVEDANSIPNRVDRGIQLVVDSIQKIISKAQELWSWITGKKSEDPEKESSSGGGGNWAAGLNYVPYNQFAAYLHKGEMVLTAAEASAYRAMRSAGNAMMMQQQTVNSNRGGDRKVEINVGRIDASNPDEGRVLLSQLAFYGG